MIDSERTAMDGGALPVSTAEVQAECFAQANQSIRKWQKPRNRCSGDVSGQVKELLTQPRMDKKIPAWELTGQPSLTWRSKALPKRCDVHPSCSSQYHPTRLEIQKSKSSPPISQHKAEATLAWMALKEVLRRATGAEGSTGMCFWGG